MSSLDEDWSRRFEDEWERWDEAEMTQQIDDDDDEGKLQDLETSSMSVESDYHSGEITHDDDNDELQRSSKQTRHYSTKELVNALGAGEEHHGNLPEAIQHRIRDFRLAQRKRRETYGNERPWGILGLYDHLASIRIDLEWAEDAAWRRQHGEPYLSWSDFDKEHKKGAKNRPFFTYFMMLFCTIMMIASIGSNGWKVEPLVRPRKECNLSVVRYMLTLSFPGHCRV